MIESSARMGAVLATLVLLAVTGNAGPASGGGNAGEPPKDGPRIDVDAMEHQFGEIEGGRGVEHVFEVYNRGTKPLVVTRVRTSCGCTAAMMETSVVDPGGSGKLRVSFNPGSRRGTTSKTVTVFSNDPVRPSLVLRVGATVVPREEMENPLPPVKRVHPKREALSFESPCAKCHVPRKGSLTGLDLFAAACAVCHGGEGEGRRIGGETIGPSLKIRQMTVKSRGGIRQVVSAGTGDPRMPGFEDEYGGPLSARQVDSLVDLLRDWPGEDEEGAHQ